MKKIITLALFCASTLWATEAVQNTMPTKCACKKMQNCACKGKMNQNKGMNMVTFEEIDTNKDGSLSKEEFSAHQAQRMKQCQKCQPNSAKCNAK
jgi:hypothetical protein